MNAEAEGAESSREASKRETREALLNAAEEEFAVGGFDGPSLDAICARAGYTRGAFYVHFQNREELVAAVMERALSSLIEAVVATGDDERDLETTVSRYIGVAAFLIEVERESSPDAPRIHFHRVLEACQRSREIRNSFVSLLEDAAHRVGRAARDGQKAERVRTDVAPDQIGALLVLIAVGIRVAVEVGLPLDLEAARESAIRLLIRTDL
jgi:AcrR family transcriptional regulator